MAGDWDNQRQHAVADPALHRPPAAGTPYPWLDQQHARFRLVQTPGLAGPDERAIHLVWRSGGPDGPISRQRLWIFRPATNGSFTMRFLMPRQAGGLAEAAPDSAAFRALGPADVVSYPASCDLPVTPTRRGFVASIPAVCEIMAGSGRTMRLEARIELDGDKLTYAEAGRLPDGSFAFRVPGGGSYCFERQTQALPARRAQC
ncbi:MAG: CpcT/CpeT family chromophore lyase [Sphingomonadaceae bacterium]